MQRFVQGACAAGALLLLAACAGTQATAANEGQLLAANDPKSRVVCEVERSVGSNRPTKVCMTIREREMLQDRSRTAVRNDNRPSIVHDHSGR